jgi:hypothetical protein
MNPKTKTQGRRSLAVLTATMVAAVATMVGAAAASAQNTPPTNTTRPTITGTLVVGKVLTAHVGSWSGTAPITYSFQWQRCNSTATDCNNIAEASQSQAYILTSDDLGHRMAVRVTASNSAGRNVRDSAATGAVKAAPTNAPVNSTPPSISGSAIQDNTLTTSNGVWNGATPTFTYRWQRCDTTGANCANILGATSQTYQPSSLDVGNTLRAIVIATNAEGTSASISHQSSTIRSSSSVQATLNSNVKVVSYGASATLTGTISGASAGDTVSIMARPGTSRTLQSVGSTTTDANGNFTKTVTPRMRTVYVAKGDGATSDGLAINVKPLVRLSHATHGSLSVRLTAAKSFVGRYVTVQAFLHGRWVAVKRVFLTRRSFGISPTIFSTATFHLSVRHGLKLRAFLTLSQAGSTYTSATSNFVRS